MKKYSTTVLYVAVLFIVLSGHIVFRESQVAQAAVDKQPSVQEGQMRIEMAPPDATNSQQVVKKSEYVLPYPGILQNHPLYFLKEMRDKIIETLIVDPLRKTEFYLLQSDKWISATKTLLNQNQPETAQKVLNIAAERMGYAVDQLKTMKDSGRQIPVGTIDKIDDAIEKHLEVVDELSVDKKISPDAARQSYLSTQDKLMKLRE